MTELLDLCYDVLIRVLEEIDPEDLAACASTSWGFNHFVKENSRLYKAHYLRNYDDPRHILTNAEPQWIPELQRVVRCQKLLQSADPVLKDQNFHFVASTLHSLITTASSQKDSSRNQDALANSLANTQNLEAFAHRSSLYAHLQKSTISSEHRQLSAKIHCLYGIPTNALGRRALATHPYARSRVYDLRNYTDANGWGPFLDDSSETTDWEMIESIMVVLGYNSSVCCRRYLARFRPPWTQPFEGVIKEREQVLPEYPSTLPNELDIPLHLKDPFNVSGIWSRIVCFLDYNDLYNFNFSPEAMKASSTTPRDPLTTEEAIRHILMQLRVTKIEAPGKFDNQTLPIVHFTGNSRSADASWDPNANSKIRGSVRLTLEGEVRWTTISVFYGEERWRSEGVQVGGLRSKRGVIGTWFDKEYDVHGPAGPTAYWKVSDNAHFGEGDEDSDTDDSNYESS